MTLHGSSHKRTVRYHALNGLNTSETLLYLVMVTKVMAQLA